jgi:hypothetical protein
MLLILQWQLKEKEKLQAALKINGGTLTAWMKGKKIIYTDEKVVCQWLLSLMLINQMGYSRC